MSIPSQSTRDPIIADVAGKLGVPSGWLDALIKLESGYDPQARNTSSGALGLIQIIDSTARSMFGMSNTQLINKYPDFYSQMYNVVLPYLRHYAPFPTEQSFFMSVFFPLARNENADTTFYELYRDNPKSTGGLDVYYNNFLPGNGGILTVADYVNRIFGRRTSGATVVGGDSTPLRREDLAYVNPRFPLLPIMLLAGAGIAIWYISRSPSWRGLRGMY